MNYNLKQKIIAKNRHQQQNKYKDEKHISCNQNASITKIKTNKKNQNIQCKLTHSQII